MVVHVLRKPLIGTVAANALAHGAGALNIDGCRIGFSAGRWPANLVHDGSDEVVETFPESNRWFNAPRNSDGKGKDGPIFDTHRGSGMGGGDSGSTARFFQQVTIE